jgi:uncharacterized protein YjbI with pentapeptide repeats
MCDDTAVGSTTLPLRSSLPYTKACTPGDTSVSSPAVLFFWLGLVSYTWLIVAVGGLLIGLILLPALLLTWMNRAEPGTANNLISLLTGAAIAFTVLFVQIVEERSREEQTEETALRLVITQGRDLRGIDVSGKDLSDSYLYNKDFSAGLFHETNLQNAVLSYARLVDAHLHHANLKGADLTEARLQRAELQHAHLNGAVLSDAQLQGANLSYADLEGANLRGANLTDAKLVAVKNANYDGAIGAPGEDEELRDKRLLSFRSFLAHELPGWSESSRARTVFFQAPNELAYVEAHARESEPESDADGYFQARESELQKTLPGYERQYSRRMRLRDGTLAYLLRLSWRHGSAHPTDEVRLLLRTNTHHYEYTASARSAELGRFTTTFVRIFASLGAENALQPIAGRRRGGGG